MIEDDEPPPWEVKPLPADEDDEFSDREIDGFLKMADVTGGMGITASFVKKLNALSPEEGAIYDALTARANNSPADAQAWQAAKEEIIRTGRLRRRAPAPNEVKIPAHIAEAMDYLTIVGVPPKDVERIARGHIDLTEPVRCVRGMEAAGRKMLVLSGDRGCGKSIAAASWLYDFNPHGRGRTVLRTTGRRFIEADRVPAFDEQRLADLAYAVALVIDDLGVPASDIDDRTMTTLLTRRYRHGLETVITTNLNIPEFTERYGDRVYDRICEVGAWLSVGTESMRSKP